MRELKINVILLWLNTKEAVLILIQNSLFCICFLEFVRESHTYHLSEL